MIHLKKFMKGIKKKSSVKISNGNIMVNSCQKFPNRGEVQKNQKCPKFKNFPSKGGGSQNLGTVPKLYLLINYDGFPYTGHMKTSGLLLFLRFIPNLLVKVASHSLQLYSFLYA